MMLMSRLVSFVSLSPSLSRPRMQDVLKHAPEVKKDGVPSYEAVNVMDYVHIFVQEVLRLHPPVPADGKYSCKDDVLPDGTKVPKGASVGFNACKNDVPHVFCCTTSVNA